MVDSLPPPSSPPHPPDTLTLTLTLHTHTHTPHTYTHTSHPSMFGVLRYTTTLLHTAFSMRTNVSTNIAIIAATTSFGSSTPCAWMTRVTSAASTSQAANAEEGNGYSSSSRTTPCSRIECMSILAKNAVAIAVASSSPGGPFSLDVLDMV